MSAPWGREGASSSADKSGQGGGRGLAVRVDVSEEGIKGHFVVIFLC